MKKFFVYLKTRPVAFASFIILAVLYFVMIFAEFFAPYPPTQSFENMSYHPANVKFKIDASEKLFGLKIQECRVLNSVNWKYARVKNLYHDVKFFAKGTPYKLWGLIPCSIHFITSTTDENGSTYPIFLMGADNLGRDLFSRIIYGSRISLTIGFIATAISLILAILIGGLAGYYGGATDWSLMRIAEFFMLIPGTYLILFLRSLLSSSMDSGKSYMIITIILALVGWPGTARTLRGIIHSVKREEFILNAQLEGISSTSIIFNQIIPQIASLLIVSTALSIPGFIMSETTLSYLGLGISDPAVSWGSLIKRDISTLSNLKNYPWLLNPVWFLLIVTLGFNFLGDALRDYFDPYGYVFTRKKKIHSNKSVTHYDNKTLSQVQTSQADKNTTPDRRLLTVNNLNVTFTMFRNAKTTSIYAVRGIDFFVNRGEVLGVVGESGSGKSVSCSAIEGLLPENAEVSGNIFYDGIDLLSLFNSNDKEKLRAYRGKKIAYIFQEPGRSFDPLQNMFSAFYETFRNSNADITKQEAEKKAIALLTETGIDNARDRLKNFPHQFSGGQLQRIGIALALAQNCELLIADEPTTALDVTIQSQIIDLLLKLKQTRNISIIFISHNIDLVAQVSDRIMVMYGGKILESGLKEQIINYPLNPYTKALLQAAPDFGQHYSKNLLSPIPGKITDPANPEKGCPFAPRCRLAQEKCKTQMPELKCSKDQTHLNFCFYEETSEEKSL